jgi:IS5 family transposase
MNRYSVTSPKRLFKRHNKAGKAHKRYEFGCKVALAITHTQGLVVSAQARHGNPYDGHTLDQTLTHAAKITQGCIRTVYEDRGYKGHGVTQTTVYLSGQKKLSRPLIKALKRRAAIEPHIGHMKSEGKLGRNYLKGIIGDQLNALLVAVGHNLRLILNFILALLTRDFF